MTSTFQSPGVYLEEFSSGPPAVQAVATAVAAFVGYTQTVPFVDDPAYPNLSTELDWAPRKVTSWAEYQTLYGGFFEVSIQNGSPQPAYTPNAVYGYFSNGGSVAYIVPLPYFDSATSQLPQCQNGPLSVTLKSALSSGGSAAITVGPDTMRSTAAGAFDVTVTAKAAAGPEIFPGATGQTASGLGSPSVHLEAATGTTGTLTAAKATAAGTGPLLLGDDVNYIELTPAVTALPLTVNIDGSTVTVVEDGKTEPTDTVDISNGWTNPSPAFTTMTIAKVGNGFTAPLKATSYTVGIEFGSTDLATRLGTATSGVTLTPKAGHPLPLKMSITGTDATVFDANGKALDKKIDVADWSKPPVFTSLTASGGDAAFKTPAGSYYVGAAAIAKPAAAVGDTVKLSDPSTAIPPTPLSSQIRITASGFPTETLQLVVGSVPPQSAIADLTVTTKTIAAPLPQNGKVALAPPPHKANAVMPSDFLGAAITDRVDTYSGLAGLDPLKDVTIVMAPDALNYAYQQAQTSQSFTTALDVVQSMLVTHCDNHADRMAILDPPPAMTPSEVQQWRTEAAVSSEFATLYYPWIEVTNFMAKTPSDPETVLMPPCGHVAGVWAKTDATRGVWKAPANEVIEGVLGLGYRVLEADQNLLNPPTVQINAIRNFGTNGIRIWGANTLASDIEWLFVSVRRLFNFIEQSIVQSSNWAVFEPNDSTTWDALTRTVTAFLTDYWSQGAFFGTSASQAFYVTCDASNNPPDQIEQGYLTCEIGIAPVRPAEFIVFRFTQLLSAPSAS